MLSDPILMVVDPSDMPGGGVIMAFPCYCPHSMCHCQTWCTCHAASCAGVSYIMNSLDTGNFTNQSTTNQVGMTEGFAATIEIGVHAATPLLITGIVLLCI